MKLSHQVVLFCAVAFCSANNAPVAAAEQLPPILVVPNGNSRLEPVLGNQASNSPAAPLPSSQPSEEKPPLLGRPDGHEPGSKDLIGRPDGHDGGSQPLIGRPDGHDGGSQPLIGRPDGHDGGSQPLIGRPDGHDGGSQPLIGRPDGHEYNSEINDVEEYGEDADDSLLNPSHLRNLGDDYSEYLGGEEEAIYNDGEEDRSESEEEKPLVRCKRPMCRMYCANGFQTDSTGCPVCACLEDPCQGVQCGAGEQCIAHECAEGTACTNLTSECVQRDADEYPDSSSEERWEPLPRTGGDSQPCATPMCADFCADGYAYDSRGCMTCDCATGPLEARVSPLCPAIDCLEDCPNGFQRDQHGCQTCDCNAPLAPAAPLECATPMCAVRCANGYKNNAQGCMTCDCNDEPQASYESKKAPVLCATPMCANWCPNGYANNEQGCMTCDCAGLDVPPRPLAGYPGRERECPLMKCVATRCASGYRYDANGCRTCECDDNGALPTCGAGVCEVGEICRNKTIKYIATPVCIAKPLCYVARERLGLSPGQSTSSARGVSGMFAPECEASGAFKPLQCDAPRGDCWCVDDRGVEIADSRTAYFVEEHKPRCERNITVALNMRMVLVRTSAFSTEDDNIDEAELTRVLAERVAAWMLIEPQFLTVLSINHEDDRVAAKLLARYDSRADLPSASAHLQRWIHLDRCRVFLEHSVLRVDPDTFEVEHKFSLTPAPVRPLFLELENVYEERVSWWPSCLTDNYYILFGLLVIGGVFILCIIFLVVIHARRRRARNRVDFERARLTSQCSVSSEKSLLTAGDGTLSRGGKDDGVLLISAERVGEKEALA